MLKGNFISTNRIIHVTGCGNFKCERIFAKGESHWKDEMASEEIVIQEEEKGADSYEIENEVDPFGAEQTEPKEEDMKCDPEYADHKVDEMADL